MKPESFTSCKHILIEPLKIKIFASEVTEDRISHNRSFLHEKSVEFLDLRSMRDRCYVSHLREITVKSEHGDHLVTLFVVVKHMAARLHSEREREREREREGERE